MDNIKCEFNVTKATKTISSLVFHTIKPTKKGNMGIYLPLKVTCMAGENKEVLEWLREKKRVGNRKF